MEWLISVNIGSVFLALVFWKIPWQWRHKVSRMLPVPLSDIMDVVVFMACLSSVLLDPPEFFALTFMQAFSITLVSGTYFYDATCWVIGHFNGAPSPGEVGDFSVPNLVHHAAGALGISVLVLTHTGGGLLVRLLLDTATNLALDLDRFCTQRRLLPAVTPHRWDIFFWLVFLLARCLWYPLVLVLSLTELWHSRPFPSALFAMLSIWTLFSTAVHIFEFTSDGLPILSSPLKSA